jgi:hypothetical protein
MIKEILPQLNNKSLGIIHVLILFMIQLTWLMKINSAYTVNEDEFSIQG